MEYNILDLARTTKRLAGRGTGLTMDMLAEELDMTPEQVNSMIIKNPYVFQMSQLPRPGMSGGYELRIRVPSPIKDIERLLKKRAVA